MHLNFKNEMLLIDLIPPTNPSEFSRLNFGSNGNECRVKGERMYMVSDDLTVEPLAMSSCLAVFDKLKICVEEVELQVGLEEVSFLEKECVWLTYYVP